MSKRTGDKSRYGRLRKQKIALRKRTKEWKAQVAPAAAVAKA